MRLSNPSTALPPDTICGYTILRSPAPATYVALADGAREVLLKPLDPDCLLHGQLHPSIKERLARVRELALKSTANLHGVERDRGGVFLVWEFIEGVPLDVHASGLPSVRLLSLMREIVLSVEALHQVGIVHGAIHGRNIIVDAANRPRMTHISPLLFHDPAVDEAALSLMLAKLVDQRQDIDASVRSALAGALPLRQLAGALVTTGRPQDQATAFDAEDRRRRRRIQLVALAIGCAGLLIAAVIVVVVGRR